MTGYLTTHVLDTALGCPAEGMNIVLYRVAGESRSEIARMRTNSDGRTEKPILPEGRFSTGTFELVFFAGDYLREQGMGGVEPLFLDEIPIRFGISDANAHYHVPLLLSPYGYGTYRGS